MYALEKRKTLVKDDVTLLQKQLRRLMLKQGETIEGIYLTRDLRMVANALAERSYTCRELADSMKMSPALMHTKLEKLERKGYVVRQHVKGHYGAFWFLIK